MKEKKRDIIFLRWLPLLLINVYVVFPIYWSFITSLKSEADIVSTPIQYIPRSPSLNNFANVWVHAGFSQYFANSLQISIVSVSIIVVLSIMVGYALTRYKFKGKSCLWAFCWPASLYRRRCFSFRCSTFSRESDSWERRRPSCW